MRDVLPVVHSARVAALAATWSRAIRQPAGWRHAWGGGAARRVGEPQRGAPMSCALQLPRSNTALFFKIVFSLKAFLGG